MRKESKKEGINGIKCIDIERVIIQILILAGCLQYPLFAHSR